MTHHRKHRSVSQLHEDIRRASRERPGPDMEETREHIMAAGREVLLAAQGALQFCKNYVETQMPEASHSNILCFFQKAIAVADELSRGLSSVSTLQRAAGTIAKPIFSALEQEMQEQARGGTRRPARKTPPKHPGRVRTSTGAKRKKW